MVIRALKLALLTPLLLLAPVAPAHAAACNGYVALTYDDGPTAQFTRPLLTALQRAGARATFFNMGSRVQQQPSLASAQVQAGMWVGNHTWSHPHLTQLSQSAIAQEISSTQNAIRQATGQTPTLFRPPYGETNGTVQAEAQRQGMAQVLWTVDTQDWNGASTANIVRAATGASAGGIVLMHDGYQTTVNAVPQIVQGLQAKNLCPGKIVNQGGRAVVVAP